MSPITFVLLITVDCVELGTWKELDVLTSSRRFESVFDYISIYTNCHVTSIEPVHQKEFSSKVLAGTRFNKGHLREHLGRDVGNEQQYELIESYAGLCSTQVSQIDSTLTHLTL